MTQDNDRHGGWLGRMRSRKSGAAGAHQSARAEARQKLAEWATSSERPAWRPVVDEHGEPTTISRFGGEPWVLDGETAPTCATCGRTLQLFVQLDLSSLPAEYEPVTANGVIQLYYCPSGMGSEGFEECWGEDGWEPFSTDVKLSRLVPRGSLHQVAESQESEASWPVKIITGWEPFSDRPHPEDHAGAGLSSNYDFQARTVRLEAGSVGVAETFGIDELPVEQIAIAADRDKLGGWPFWVQGAEYPSCHVCGEQMEVLFQLDSEDHVPFMFGDAGIGHISMCRSHPEVVAFGWACG